MKKFLKAILQMVIRLLVNWTRWMVRMVKNDLVSQEKLGDIFDIMRNSNHANDVIQKCLKYQIHPSVTWGQDTQIYGSGMISIGANTYIGRNCFISSSPDDAKIEIGEYCAISHNVNIRTTSYKTDIHFKDVRISSNTLSKNIIIKDYVWIGANVFISGGIIIGENSIVGANSVVTHNIPPNSVCGGVPARVIRYKFETDSVKTE